MSAIDEVAGMRLNHDRLVQLELIALAWVISRLVARFRFFLDFGSRITGTHLLHRSTLHAQFPVPYQTHVYRRPLS